MKLALIFLLAAPALHFEITDGRGKKPSGISIEAGAPDADGWCPLTMANKSKGDYTLIWPYDAKAKTPDGPEGVPVIVLERKNPKSVKVVAAITAAKLLGVKSDITVDLSVLDKAEDSFAKGIGLLAANKPADAIDPLGRALKERERQLTRVPSEIYPAAMLYGKALFEAAKYDDAALAYLKAIKQRPSDPAARKARAKALVKAGKPEAAQEIPE
jgi:tetratricopeptide (TPR) repeat protein